MNSCCLHGKGARLLKLINYGNGPFIAPEAYPFFHFDTLHGQRFSSGVLHAVLVMS